MASIETSNTRFHQIFSEVADAIDHGRLEQALRCADRARRLAPRDATCRLLYARMLVMTGAASAAREALRDLDEPDAVLVRAQALCAQGLWEQAFHECESLLMRFAVDSIDGLTELAEQICDGPHRPLGWIGVNRNLRIVGQVRRGAPLRIMGADCIQPLPADGRDQLLSFEAEPVRGIQASITAFAGDSRIMGSGFAWPPAFGIQGWIYFDGSDLRGEVGCRWSPVTSMTLSIRCCPQGHTRTVPIDPDPFTKLFSVVLDAQELEAKTIEVLAIGPDGVGIPLIGSPLTIASSQAMPIGPMPSRPSRPQLKHSAAAKQKIDVVIPVYRGYDATLACLESVLFTTDRRDAKIVIVDDDAPEPRLREALDDFARAGDITLLRNRQNLGFPGSANRGMQLHPDRDVVLLNSDTVLFGDWLDRLRSAAAQAEEIGTVTPLGNAGSVTDYSLGDQSRFSAAEIDGISRQINAGKLVDIPVGVGFCLYIKRACLDETGMFDEVSFGRGYGEENDFCLRARRLGWRHVASTDTFIEHLGGKSYGKDKQPLVARNSRVLSMLHPGYDTLIADFAAADTLLDARREIDLQILLCRAEKPVLIMTLELPGGVKRHVDQRRAELTAAGHTVLVLQPGGKKDKSGVVLRVESLGLENLAFTLPEDAHRLKDLLGECRLSHVEIHHFLGLPSETLEIATTLGVPYSIYIHDYSWICPRITLVGGNGGYCNEPPLTECERCVGTHGSEMERSLSVMALRARSAEILAGAASVTVPSRDTRERVARYFPIVPINIEPWESLPVPNTRPMLVQAQKKVRVAVIGAIGIQKGHAILLECARDAAQRGLDLEFVVIGYTHDDAPLLATKRVFITGPYDEGEIAALLDREQCQVAFFASISPETWCYSLTHAMNYGLPVIAFDHGAVAERLLAYSASEVLPLSTSPACINDRLLNFTQTLLRGKQETAMDLSSNLVEAPDIAEAPDSASTPAISRELMSSVQVLSLPEGIYSFSVHGGGEEKVAAGQLALPALQVGLAPTPGQGSVEFLVTGSSLDRWLAYDSDMVVVRIVGGEAAMLLTSLRAEQSPVLNVNVARLQAEQGEPWGRLVGGASSLLPVHVLVHLKNIGDLHFDNGWAGWMGQRLWIEAFAIASIGDIPPDLIEYRGITADGLETPWLSNQLLCGTRGMGIPMTGYAVRLKPEISRFHDCVYSARFLSGAKVGPCQDGALCSSAIAGDFLEGIEVQVVRHVDSQSSL